MEVVAFVMGDKNGQHVQNGRPQQKHASDERHEQQHDDAVHANDAGHDEPPDDEPNATDDDDGHGWRKKLRQ